MGGWVIHGSALFLTKSCSEIIFCATPYRVFWLHKITPIKLNGGFFCKYFDCDTANIAYYHRRFFQRGSIMLAIKSFLESFFNQYVIRGMDSRLFYFFSCDGNGSLA